MDFGTGGGFPGIPLAILFPDVIFYLVDSVGKKISVVQKISDEIGLQNVHVQTIRGEQFSKKTDFIISRAVSRMDIFVPWVKNKINSIKSEPPSINFINSSNFKLDNNNHKYITIGKGYP